MIGWIDVETTGLNPNQHLLLEVGLVVTTNDLQVVDKFSTFVDHRMLSPVAIKLATEQFVVDMHTASGLWDEYGDPDREHIPVSRATKDCIEFLALHGIAPQMSPMAGSNVPFDRAFITRFLPDLADYFHYRNLDVSAIKEATRFFSPKVWETRPDDPDKAHRPIPDLLNSIAEMQHYKTNLFDPAMETA